VGRSPNLYEVTDREVRVSIPDRRYELLGTILAGALARSGEGAALVSEEARQRGWESGRSAAVARRLRRPGAERALAVAAEVLAGCGYEPYRDGADVALANCPFHVVAKDAPDLVCGANRAFVDGVLRGLGDERVNAVLVPPDGGCCVRLVGPVERRRRPS
jgi:predicted ArsR family transcriptional regulator